MSEEQVDEKVTADGTADADTEDDVSLLGASVTVGADGKRTVNVPLDTLIGLRKDKRELGRKVKELEPVAARVTEVNGRLAEAQPIINAVLSNAKLRAEALRGVHGEQAQEVAEQVDADAAATAEDFNLYLADGRPNVAAGRKILERMGGVARRTSEEVVRPIAGLTLNSQAEANVREALAMTDNDGVPLATPESIRETAKLIGPQLLANPGVRELMINNAIGLDRRNGRTPKAVEEPIHLERSASRRGRSEVIYTEEDRARHQRLGISEADAKRADQQLRTGRAITFEGA